MSKLKALSSPYPSRLKRIIASGAIPPAIATGGLAGVAVDNTMNRPSNTSNRINAMDAAKEILTKPDFILDTFVRPGFTKHVRQGEGAEAIKDIQNMTLEDSAIMQPTQAALNLPFGRYGGNIQAGLGAANSASKALGRQVLQTMAGGPGTAGALRNVTELLRPVTSRPEVLAAAPSLMSMFNPTSLKNIGKFGKLGALKSMLSKVSPASLGAKGVLGASGLGAALAAMTPTTMGSGDITPQAVLSHAKNMLKSIDYETNSIMQMFPRLFVKGTKKSNITNEEIVAIKRVKENNKKIKEIKTQYRNEMRRLNPEGPPIAQADQSLPSVPIMAYPEPEPEATRALNMDST